MITTFVATGPIVHPGNGAAARRTVLKVMTNSDGTPSEFIVHRQYFYEDGGTAFEYGDYFPVRVTSEKVAYAGAWSRFKERADQDVSSYDVANPHADPDRFRQILDSLATTGKGGV